MAVKLRVVPLNINAPFRKCLGFFVSEAWFQAIFLRY